MKKNNIKIRIIACVLALITVFSIGAISITSASAAASKPPVVHQVSVDSICKSVEKFFTKGIGEVVLKIDTNDALKSVSATGSDQSMTTDHVLNTLNDLKNEFLRDHNIVTVFVKIIDMAFHQS